MTTKRIVWNTPEEPTVKYEIPSPNAVKELGLSSFDDLIQYIINNKLPKNAAYFICENTDLPDRKYRNAYVCDHGNKRVILDPDKCRYIDALNSVNEEMINEKKQSFESRVQQKLST